MNMNLYVSISLGIIDGDFFLWWDAFPKEKLALLNIDFSLYVLLTYETANFCTFYLKQNKTLFFFMESRFLHLW